MLRADSDGSHAGRRPPRAAERAVRTLIASLVLGAALVASHRGEFWPFSIYPMFSRAGRPFTRTVVRQLAATEPIDAAPRPLSALPGIAFPLAHTDISQNDVASFAAPSARRGDAELGALAALFRSHTAGRRLVVFAVRGRLGGGEVELSAQPLAELTEDSARFFPHAPLP
jgi:hypothetical protein